MIYLLILAALWLAMWRRGVRACRAAGIHRGLDSAVLATIAPCAALVLAVHLPAYAALLSGVALVTLPAATATCAALAAAWFVGTARVADCSAGPPALGTEIQFDQPPRASLRWVVTGLGATYGLFFLDAVTRFPTGYDGLKYHLPVAVNWMRAGRLDLVHGNIYYSLPENAMIPAFLLVSAGWERALSLCQFPCAVVLLSSVFCLTRRLGASSAGAIGAACIAASMPLVLFQTFSSYVDLFGAAWWMVALLALVWASRVSGASARRGLITLSGVAAGLALGSKSTYLIHVALLVPLAAWAGGESRPSCGASLFSSRARAAALFAGAALICSGFWFMRGAVQAGNPVYPFGLTVFGNELLPGFDPGDHVPARSWARKLAMWLTYPWRETNYAGSGYDFGVNNGLGAAYTCFVPLSLLYMVTNIRHFRSGTARLWIGALGGLSLAAPLLIMTALTEVLRYALPLLVCGVALAGLFIDQLYRVHPRMTARILTASVAVTCCVAALPPARALAARVRDDQWSRAWQYQVPAYLDTLPAGSRILFFGPPDLIYPLMGEGFRHDVVHEDIWRATYGNSCPTVEQLSQAGVDYILLRTDWPVDWGGDIPGTLIFDDTSVRALPTTAVTRLYSVEQVRGAEPG